MKERRRCVRLPTSVLHSEPCSLSPQLRNPPACPCHHHHHSPDCCDGLCGSGRVCGMSVCGTRCGEDASERASRDDGARASRDVPAAPAHARRKLAPARKHAGSLAMGAPPACVASQPRAPALGPRPRMCTRDDGARASRDVRAATAHARRKRAPARKHAGSLAMVAPPAFARTRIAGTSSVNQKQHRRQQRGCILRPGEQPIHYQAAAAWEEE